MGLVRVAIRVMSTAARMPPSQREDITRRSSAVLFSLMVGSLPLSLGSESLDGLGALENVPLFESLLFSGIREVFSLGTSALRGSFLSPVGGAVVGCKE